MHSCPAPLIRAIGGALLFAAASAPAVARADVLEIDSTGSARWIAGPQAVMPGVDASVAAQSSEGVLPDDTDAADLAIPDHIIAEPARHAGAIPASYAARVAELSRRFDLSPALIEALVWQESRWNSAARSPVGARGLAQLMPATARELGVDPDDPSANLEGGARYLRQQLDRFDGDVEKALAAYNAGPGRVIAAGGIPRIRETQGYVAAIMGRLSNHSRDSN